MDVMAMSQRVARMMLLVCAPWLVAQPAVGEQPQDCSAQQGLTFLCGLHNAEDLVRIEGTGWMIASGMSGEGVSGHMYLLDPENRSYEELYPGKLPAHRWNKDEFASCPGELNTANFSAHGLAIRELGGGLHRLYVTSHGAREAVEIFEVNTRVDKPNVAWVGCVVMPEQASINSVAALPSGGFMTTRIMTEGPGALADIFAGDITGFLYEWHPGGELGVVAGTEMSGPNGIEVSPDGKKVFVASWGRGEIVRFGRSERGSLTHEHTSKLNFRVDNLRWSKQGTLYAAGHRLSQRADCNQQLCIAQWEVAEVDPVSMTVQTRLVKQPSPGFAGATVAIDAAGGLWLGTFEGDRIGFAPNVVE